MNVDLLKSALSGDVRKDVTQALEAVEGVSKATVSLDEKSAVVELSSDVSDSALVDAVVQAGYEATIA